MRFRRRLQPEARVDLVPMIDVVLQLVFFFMVTSTFVITPGIHIVFPTSSTTQPVPMTKLVVTVVSQDEVYVDKEKLTLAGLGDRLAKYTSAQKKNIGSVILEADRDVSYDLMVKVLDQLRLHGFPSVSLRLKASAAKPPG